MAEAAAPLRAAADRVSWVAADNLHATLKFLGDVADGRVEEIAGALRAAVARIGEFDLALRGLGAFPTPIRARVLWAGVSAGGRELAALASAVDRSLRPLGFPPEARPFSPHVTLGRVREPRPDPALAEALARAAGLELGSVRVDRVLLMRSQLSPRGARYSEVAGLPLAAGEPKK